MALYHSRLRWFAACLRRPAARDLPSSRTHIAWRTVVGETVAVEGVFWGIYEKGYGPYVILNRANIYVQADDLTDKQQGSPIRVVGKLRLKEHRPDPKDFVVHPDGSRSTFVQGSPYPNDIYWIDVTSWKMIDRVSWPWMTIVRE